MAQGEQETEGVIWNRAVAQLPVLPGSVGNLAATRRGGHTQAQSLAAVAEFFGGHKVFQVRSAGRNVTPDATSLQNKINQRCRFVADGSQKQLSSFHLFPNNKQTEDCLGSPRHTLSAL